LKLQPSTRSCICLFAKNSRSLKTQPTCAESEHHVHRWLRRHSDRMLPSPPYNRTVYHTCPRQSHHRNSLECTDALTAQLPKAACDER
jgi:hypothetical protein